jgi:hypothetical protein
MSEKFSTMRNLDDPLGSSDYLRENQDSLSLEQLNYRVKLREVQIKSHQKKDEIDHEKADIDLDNEISSMEISNKNELNAFLEKHYPNNPKAERISREFFKRNASFGIAITIKELEQQILEKIDNIEDVSTAEQIKNYKEELTEQGKSQSEILQLLISKFEGNEAVSVWVENWQNFQKLNNFAKNKPPAEQRAIQNIISKADFSNESAFSTSLAEISQSTEISNETKFEVSKQFGGAHIKNVDGMDYQLQQVKKHTEAIEKEIGVKSSEKNLLDSEIESLEDEIDKLPLDDPKRQELEEKLEQKKEVLEETENEIDRLEKGKPKDVSFQLRESFSAIQNADGSRSIKVGENFAIKIPSNRLPFTNTKNLRAINLAFPYTVLRNLHIADTVFSPNLENNTLPSKSQRDMGHLILSSLGIDDTKILSEENIQQLKKDLSFLNPQNGKTGQENLIDLGIFDVESQSLVKEKLKEVLTILRKEGLKSKKNLYF